MTSIGETKIKGIELTEALGPRTVPHLRSARL
jgi:hypothetical protein